MNGTSIPWYLAVSLLFSGKMMPLSWELAIFVYQNTYNMNILYSILIGVLAGFLAGKLMKGRGFGFLVNLLVGVVGGVIGGVLLPLPGVLGSIITATLGAVILLFIISLFKK